MDVICVATIGETTTIVIVTGETTTVVITTGEMATIVIVTEEITTIVIVTEEMTTTVTVTEEMTAVGKETTIPVAVMMILFSQDRLAVSRIRELAVAKRKMNKHKGGTSFIGVSLLYKIIYIGGTMRIVDILKEEKVHISCELFPPKQGHQLENVKHVVRDIAQIKPVYMSVTYGATGGTSDYTVDIANEIQNVNGIPALAHLTCASSTREKVHEVVNQLKEKKIENILTLRGDIPENADFPLPNQYKHAYELIADVKSLGDFCLGGACYPEGHPEAETMHEDIEHLKEKVDAGCDFLTTQMFFDNDIYYNFMYKILKKNINVPVVAGIMPVTNAAQIKRIISLSGNMVPPRFKAIVDRFSDNPAAMKQAGIAYATEQIIDLIANGVNNIHIYTMNKPDVAGAIFDNLSEIYIP